MAAPMQHMAAAGQFMPQQQNRFGMGGGQSMDIGQFVYQHIANSTVGIPPGGWQNSVPIAERVRIVQELISNMLLANADPSISRQQVAMGFVRFELEAFGKSPDKATYDHRTRSKIQELVQKRQNQAGQLQDAMNMQQRQQQMLLQQQQQTAALMRAQMGRGGGPGQPAFQHLQNPMQVSQLPQQAPQMGLSLSNGMPTQMKPGQPGFPMPGGPQHAPNQPQLSDGDRARVQQEAQRLMQEAGPQGRKAMAETLVRQIGPQNYQRMQAEGKNPLHVAFWQRAMRSLFPQGQQQQQPQPGMPSNPQGMGMQPGQQRQNMMNNMGQPGGQLPYGRDLEKIINEQKQGMLAERQGQMVVPASSGPGHIATSQPPLSGGQPQNMFPQTPNQTPRPQMPNGFDMQQQALIKQQFAQSQAQQLQARQAAANLQGQPGGLGGPMPASQTPAMNALNAPVGQPPVAMGQMPGAQDAPGNAPFGLDARFNQAGPQGSMPGGPNYTDPLLKMMLSSLAPDMQARLRRMSKQQLEDTFTRWKIQQGFMPGPPGQPQPGLPMNSSEQNTPTGMPMQQANGNMPPNMQAILRQQNQNRMRQTGAMANPQAVMDNMDVPPQVFNAIQGIPSSIKKWGQFKIWIQATNTITDQTKTKLKALQMQQFQQIAQARANMMGPGRGPGVEPQQPGALRPPLPPGAQQIEVTPQEIQKLRQGNAKARELPDEQIRMLLQSYKYNAMQKAGNQQLGPHPGQPPQLAAPPSTQPGPSMPAGMPQGLPQGPTNLAAASVSELGQNASAAAPPAKKPNQPPQQGKPVPPNPSPAVAAKNLKRASTDDQEAPAQPAGGMQRPSPQTGQHAVANGPPNGFPNPTEAQLASLSPEQRQAWERRKQMQKQAHEFSLFYKNLAQEEARSFDASKLKDVPVPDHAREGYKAQLLQIAQGFVRVSHPSVLAKWYFSVRDEARLRMFLKWRLRVISHFEDGDKLQIMKDRFTVTPPELQQCKALLTGVFQEMKQPPRPADQQTQPTPKPTAAPQPIEANSAKSVQVQNKLPQRPNSRGVQPPAAPTSSQPPFPFGAQSPDGKPVWAAPAQVTQEKLQIPQTKRRKTGPQTSSPAGNSQNASPQTTKATSPELKKQEPKAAPKQPTFPCTIPDCEMGGPTFDSDALRKKHVEEFHMLPFQNPQQFLEQIELEVYEQANQARPEGGVPTSRDAYMKPQGSVAGGPAAQGAKPNDHNISGGPKPPDNSTPGQSAIELPPQQIADDLGLGSGTIDPQSLFAPAFSFDPAFGGVISNPSIYRSTTPNEDTPESSKDSGASEPNSDIHEASALDIDINFAEYDDGMLMNLNFGGDTDPNFETITDDMLVDMDSVKPFQPLDMSLYEWNH